MTDFSTIFTIIGGVASLSFIITGASIYILRKTSERLETNTKESLNKTEENTQKAISGVKDIVIENSERTRSDYQTLVTHIDDRIEKIHSRLDSSQTELKEYVAREVASLKAKDYDQDIKIDHTKEKIGTVNEDLLKFKLEVAENYEKKSG